MIKAECAWMITNWWLLTEKMALHCRAGGRKTLPKTGSCLKNRDENQCLNQPQTIFPPSRSLFATNGMQNRRITTQKPNKHLKIARQQSGQMNQTRSDHRKNCWISTRLAIKCNHQRKVVGSFEMIVINIVCTITPGRAHELLLQWRHNRHLSFLPSELPLICTLTLAMI